MKRVYILDAQERQEELVARLQKLGVLHLEESKLDQDQTTAAGEAGPVAKDRRDVENSLIKARGVIDLFKEIDPALLDEAVQKASSMAPLDEISAEFRKEVDSLEGRLKKLVSERRELRDRQNAGEMLKAVVQTGEELARELSHQQKPIVAMIGEPKDSRAIIEEIRNTLNAPLSGKYSIASKVMADKRLMLLVSVDAEYAPLVQAYIEEKGLRPVTLPPHVPTEFVKGIAQLKAEETTIPARLQEVERDLASLAKQHDSRVLVLANALENRMAQLEAGARFGYTDYVTLISGWIPHDEQKEFAQTLQKEFPGIIIQDDVIDLHHDEVPTAYRERKWAQPYKLFLDAFGTPKYVSVDPIPTISIFFPIFFGIIVGDIAYGLVVLLLALWGLSGFAGVKKPGLKKIAKSSGGQAGFTVMRDGAVMSILFGFLFGEIGGLEFTKHFGIAQMGLWPFSRTHFSIDLLNFMLVVGFLQVTLGFVFGVATAIWHHNRKEFFIKIGLYFALLSFAVVVGSLMKLNDPDFLHLGFQIILGDSTLLVGLGIFVITVVFLAAVGGMIAAVEALSPFIHVLSYARLMGFALAGAVLAALINDMVSGIAAGGIGGIQILGILAAGILAVFLHAVNLGLHVFEGSIQSARLHWVEFFGKFILENLGGKPYQPFKEKRLSD